MDRVGAEGFGRTVNSTKERTMNGEAKRDAMRKRLYLLAGGGRLTPDAVVEEARDPSSPMHNEFEWDDSVAGSKYRREQARGLITSFKVSVQYRTTLVSAPAFVRDPEAGPNEQGYRETLSLKTDRDRARDALLSEVGRAASHLQRCRDLSVALELDDMVDDVIAGFGTFKRSLEA